MAKVTVVRYQRRKKLGDINSPMVTSLKQKSGDSKTYDIQRLSSEIEGIGSLSAEDVEHVIKSIVRSMRSVLCDGNRVKLDGFGTFFITLGCSPTEKKEDCTIRSIKRVNVRFKVDNALRLVNDSTATTKSAPNNIIFDLESPKTDDNTSGGSTGDGSDTGDGSGDGKDDDPLG